MSWFHALRERATSLFLGGSRDHELEQEIAHHLAMETQRQIDAGFEPRVARERALARFGNRQQVTDATREARGGSLLEGGMQDLRWAARSLRKNLGFTSLALFTLALGIGATTAAFTVLDTVLLRPLPYRDADRLVLIQEVSATKSLMPPSYPNFADWRERGRPFEGVVSAMYPFAGTVTPSLAGSEPQRVTMMGVSRDFFRVLGAPPVVGREFTDTENAIGGGAVAVVSHEFWRDHMGSRPQLGTIRWGDDPYEVVGVLAPNFRFVIQADVYFPHERGPGTVRNAHNYMVVGRLKPDVALEQARTEMTALSRAMHAEFGDLTQAVDVDVKPLRDYVVGNFRTLVTIVFGAAGMVLLIACVNLLSAQLARGWSREHEVVVRAALGASRTRLVRQLCFESGLLAVIGATLGVGLAYALVGAIRSFGVGLLPRVHELSIDARSLAFVVLATVLTMLVVGLYPAVRHSRGRADLALRSTRGTGTTVQAALWRALVGFEVALAVVLLVGSGLLIRTLHNILTSDTGVDVRNVVTATFAPRKADVARTDQIERELAALPGMIRVAFTTRLPFTWSNYSAPVRRPGDPVDRAWPAFAGFRIITPGYFDVLRLKVTRGRAFASTDREGAVPVAVITQGIADKLWPGQEPIGKTVATNYMAEKWLTVVGIVSEATIWSMPRGAQNEIYVPLAQTVGQTGSQLIAVIRTSVDPATVTPTLRAKLREIAPASPSQLGTLEERVQRTAADRRFAMLSLTAFGVVALVLATVGIYGVMWYVVTTRTREIGIRMALGATSHLVQRQMLGGALLMAVTGILVGLGGGLFATRYLQSSLYGVSRLDPSTFAFGAVITLVAALVGAYLPARRSSRVDPMVAIRAE